MSKLGYFRRSSTFLASGLVTLLLLVSCASNRHHMGDNGEAIVSQNHLTMATLWVKTSGEYRANAYQAYNLARRILDDSLRKKSSKKRAIILDADETLIDNSYYQVSNMVAGKGYSSSSWAAWVEEAQALAIPGAVEFLKYANKKGVEIFYLSNRKVSGIEASFKNLKQLGFPVKKENLLFREKENSKQPRREMVAKKYNVVLLVGDNLADFSNVFERPSANERAEAVNKLQNNFGQNFVILPNPMYGDWENVLYEKGPSTPDAEKSQARLNMIKSFLK